MGILWNANGHVTGRSAGRECGDQIRGKAQRKIKLPGGNAWPGSQTPNGPRNFSWNRE
jgi:hypothetical protein